MKPTFAELRENCEMATPGPWLADLGNWQIESRHQDHYRDGICRFTYSDRDRMDGSTNPVDFVYDAEFIAASRTALPLLLDEIEKLRDTLAIYANGDHLNDFEEWDSVSGEEIVENSLWAQDALAKSKERLP